MEEQYSTAGPLGGAGATAADPVVLFAVDADGVFTLSEGTGLASLGLSPGEMVGRSAFEVYEREPRVAGNLRRALSGEAFSSVVEMPGPVFGCSYNPLRGPDGAVVGAVGVALDVSGRRRAEDALVESEERYRRLVEAVREGIALIGPEGGTIQYCNEAYAGIFGLLREELVGRSFFEFVEGEDEEEARRQREVRLRGEGSSYEVTVTAADGRRKVLRCGGYPIAAPDGSFGGAVQTAADVTEERRAQEALRKSEERFRLVTRATGEVIWDLDLLADVQTWDGAVEAAFGYPKRQVTDNAWWEGRVHPEDRERVLGKVAEVLRPDGGETWRDEYRFRKADGSYAVVADRAYVVRDGATGEPVRMLGAMADVTERRRDEEALRRGEELHRLTFEAAPVGLAHVAPDGRWLEINDKLCGISGYSREELLGMTYRDVMHPDDLGAGLERLGRLLRGESGPYSAEARYVRKDGSRVWARVSVSLVRGLSGEPERLVCVAEDVTQRKLRELMPDPLDEREIEVLRGIAAGKTIEQIARDTVSSPGTVKRDARRVLAKLRRANAGIETREQAARWAVEIGLIPPP